MRNWVKIGSIFVLGLMVSMLFLAACGDGNGDNGDITSTPPPSPTREPIVITIGNHTDMTGVSSTAMIVITKALEDMAAYYTDEQLVPGVNFNVITFDGSYNPAYDIPGYEELKRKGADLFFGNAAPTPVSLKHLLERDKLVFFTAAPPTEAFIPPGWVFACGNTLIQWSSATLLKWIAANDRDFPRDRPATIGGAFWNENYGQDFLAGAEAYVMAHLEQYEWAGGFLSDWSFVWDEEIEALKDCDYVLPPLPPNQFVKQYRKGGGKAKLIGSDAHIAFLTEIERDDSWSDFDGMWLVMSAQWWNDTGEIVDLTKTLLQTYRPDEMDEIIETGIAYLSTQQIYVMLELIKEASASVGPENLNSQAIFDAAKSFSITVDGCPHSYNENKRTSSDALSVYEIDAAKKDIFREGPSWLPVVYKP